MPDALLHHSDRDTPPDEATPDWDNSPSFYCFNFLTQGGRVDEAGQIVRFVRELQQLVPLSLRLPQHRIDGRLSMVNKRSPWFTICPSVGRGGGRLLRSPLPAAAS